MSRDPEAVPDRLDALLSEADPVALSTVQTARVAAALDDLGTAIARPPERPVVVRKRRATLGRLGVVVIGITIATASVAADFLRAHTGQFQPTQTDIAHAGAKDAARMRSELAMGGPGEFLDPAAPDFRAVALQLASDIPYPQGYESWRDFLISLEVTHADGGTESTGALHGWFAASAFCAWVQSWRQGEVAGDTSAAAHASEVVSAAPGWKAVTDEDPDPQASAPADMGTTYTLFGWMLPYRAAVLAGDRAQVEQLLATGYGDKCWISDPSWIRQMTSHPEWQSLSRDQMAGKFEAYLEGRSSP
jgi:hypothetical protein